MTFDDLAGGSSIIQVYQGAQNTSKDKSVTGTYRDGETASAECKTIGRIVNSDPTLGEEKQSSNQWIRLAEGPGTGVDPQYATVVYLHKSGELLLQLPNC